MPRPRKGYHFTRQAAGNIVFKYLDEFTGRWRSKRVPPHVVAMADAVEWIRVNFYGGDPQPPPAQPTASERVQRLQALIASSTNPHEVAAAQKALDIALAKPHSP